MMKRSDFKASRLSRALVGGTAALLFVGGIFACGGSSGAKQAPVAAGGSTDQNKWPDDDKTMCGEWRQNGLEASETAGLGAIRPNVRRVYKSIGGGDGEPARKILVCREVDTNLDGIKDVARMFSDKGEAQKEVADRNYDGKPEIWISFVDGRMSEEQTDTNLDGKVDVWKYYVQGTLQRVKRDRDFDGNADIWEIYVKGHIERVGVDDSHDGHVDRWDRDEQARYEAEEAERKAREAMDAKNAAADSGAPADAGAAGSAAKKKKK